MQYQKLSPCIITELVDECRDFYTKHFNATLTFDCGWYINIYLGNEDAEFQFMKPQTQDQVACNPQGLTYNIQVENVDEEYKKLTAQGLKCVLELEEHPWGDKGFAIKDPAGITLYIYSLIEPSEEFKKYYK